MIKHISITLVAVIVCAFLVRGGSFTRKHPITYDETVYSVLAAQMKTNPSNYNTKVLYNDALKQGRKLPPYFNKPLFKHPPLFPGIIAIFYMIFGDGYLSAFKVSLLFGILLIPLAYLLGRTLFDTRVGVYAAFLMAIEPIVWISSQKIWMETTLAFFTMLAVYLFALAVKKNKDILFILSGLAAGLAGMTKYSGLLAMVIIFVYALLVMPQLFRKKLFIASLFVPGVVMLPWIDWNMRVYGGNFLFQSGDMASRLNKLMGMWPVGVAVLALVVAFLVVHAKYRAFHDKILSPALKKIAIYGSVAAFIGLMILLRGSMLKGFNIDYVPETSFRIGMFEGKPWYFYLGRVIELSPFYFFSYAALISLFFDQGKRKEYFLMFISSAVILGFYVWAGGGYQCRYITAAAVPMMILSAKAQWFFLDRIKGLQKNSVKKIAYAVCGIVFIYLFLVTFRVDMVLAYPNTACYF